MNAALNRRALLYGALSAGLGASVAPLPAIAAAEAPDPVFAGIEALRRATAQIDDLRDKTKRVQYGLACDAEDAAFDALTETLPTTRAGMRSLLEFLDDWSGGNNGHYFDYTLLLRSPLLA
jgi:hypothetical protein